MLCYAAYTVCEVEVDLICELCLFPLLAQHSLFPGRILSFVQGLYEIELVNM